MSRKRISAMWCVLVRDTLESDDSIMQGSRWAFGPPAPCGSTDDSPLSTVSNGTPEMRRTTQRIEPPDAA